MACLTAHDSYGLSRLHSTAYLNEVLRIVGIDRLQTIGVAHHDDIALRAVFLGYSHHSIEHRLHGIALLRGDLHIIVFQLSGLAYREGKRITALLEMGEVDGESQRTVEEPRSSNTNLLLLKLRE